MTEKEKVKVAMLIGAARSAVFQIRWYINDYDSSELKGIADYLEEAINEFTRKKENN